MGEPDEREPLVGVSVPVSVPVRMFDSCRRFGVELVLIAFAAVMAIGFLVT